MKNDIKDTYEFILANVAKKSNIPRLTATDNRVNFENEIDRLFSVGYFTYIDKNYKKHIKKLLIDHYDNSNSPKSTISNPDIMTKNTIKRDSNKPVQTISNIDMIHRNLKADIPKTVREFARTKRLYQELDNIVYDFGSFHVFYTLRCLFMDIDDGTNTTNIKRR